MSSIPINSPTSSSQTMTRVRDNAFSLHTVLSWLGSMKITVASFFAAIGLIFLGTLAQVNRDVWQVFEVYFRVWITWVDVGVLFPTSWFPQLATSQAAAIFSLVAVVGAGLGGALIWLNRNDLLRAPLYAAALMGLGIFLAVSVMWKQGFIFPGGALIGATMGVNLLAAHLTRYKIRAKGNRLAIGLAWSAAGLVLTWLVISSGHNAGGFQGQPPFEWTTLWQWVKGLLTITALGLIAYGLFVKASTRYVRPICVASGLLLGAIAIWLWSTGTSTYLGNSGMRVLWQLILATLAGIVLLIGAVLLFYQRAGVVVLHMGIGLLMFGQWFVYQYDVEEQMTFTAGQTLNYGQDIRSVELAVIRRSSPEFTGKDDVFAIPLTHNGHPTSFLQDRKITAESLPFDVEIVDYQQSSTVEMNRDEKSSPVDQGQNKEFRIVPTKPASGTMGEGIDLASGYFRFKDRKTGSDVGTFLLSQESLMMRGGMARTFDLETVTTADAEYDVQLRFVRNYKPYTLSLLDFKKEDYLGTNIPKDFASTVRLQDEERGIDQEMKIWMNNPRRYAGETFYQSGWRPDPSGRLYTTLQVVRNRGWMIPYVACMITVVGMCHHFLLMLLRFLDRTARDSVRETEALTTAGHTAAYKTPSSDSDGSPSGWRRWGIPLGVALVFLLGFAKLTAPHKSDPDGFDLVEFGKLPLVYQGRVKPYDTLARNTLRYLADAETFKAILPAKELAATWPAFEKELVEEYPEIKGVDLAPYKTGDTNGLVNLILEKSDNADVYSVSEFVEKRLFKRQPALRFLLDVMTGSDSLQRHKVVRIYHPQILDLLDLKRRKYYRYSIEEIMPQYQKLEEQIAQADRVRRENINELSLYQKKLMELDRKLAMIMSLHRAFSPPQFPELPSPAEFGSAHEGAMAKLQAYREAMLQQEEMFRRQPPPLAVAPSEDGEPWQAYAAAWPVQVLSVTFLGKEPPPTFRALNEVMLAYVNNDVAKFNSGVANYQKVLEQVKPEELQTKPSAINAWITNRFGNFYRFETEFNQVAPFSVCSYLYVLAFALLAIGWLRYTQTMNRIAYALLVCTFIVHTLALAARIYISGRPPVTNLYSSAVFIGWGIVLLALIIELFFRRGIASLVASAFGFTTLLIAHKLAAEGDTFEVLQAVLDTQFWLATHVVCITFGYATTFLAGGLGVLYIARGLFTKSLDDRVSRDLTRMIYGTLCFSILFSFFGTVLGGLWADESWGRFWGWDPKENGALIIVLWNALILHARWDRMVGNRGLAVLSVVGNIVTAWSWFGVNELGVGLHSYGFTEGRLLALAESVVAMAVIAVLGCLPLSMWSSRVSWSDKDAADPAA
ncbi:MAG: cytochrome c biogenesis protein CcsA [Planctomycetales bacterium]|nr:cytochrome c biogenesis protein CcsA [Planctomycetales bacterium]